MEPFIITHTQNEVVFIRNTEDEKWNKIKVLFNIRWYEDPELFFVLEFPKNGHVQSIKGIRVEKYGSILVEPTVDPKLGYPYRIADYTLKDKVKEEFKPCILVTTYPNTDEKEAFLKRHIKSLKPTGLPIYLASNMLLSQSIVNLADGYIYTGPNENMRMLDFMPVKDAIKKIKKDYKPLKILQHAGNAEFYYDINNLVFNRTNYHWSAIKLTKRAYSYLGSLGFTHVMKSEGEFILDTKDVLEPLRRMNRMKKEGIEGIYYIREDNFHIEGYLSFVDLSFCNSVYQNFSKEDFFFSDTTPENYIRNRIFSSGRYKKLMISSLGKYTNFISTRGWISGNVEFDVINEPEVEGKVYGSIRHFLPNTKEIHLSSNRDLEYDVDPELSLEFDVFPNNETLKSWRVILRNHAIGKCIDPINIKLEFISDDTVIRVLNYSIRRFEYIFMKSFEVDAPCQKVRISISYKKGEEYDTKNCVRILEY